MALTKADIIEEISVKNGFSKKKAAEALECMLEIIKGNLAGGENVLISGFGKLCVKKKKERKGRNPATGEKMMLEARNVVTFRCSGKLREKING